MSWANTANVAPSAVVLAATPPTSCMAGLAVSVWLSTGPGKVAENVPSAAWYDVQPGPSGAAGAAPAPVPRPSRGIWPMGGADGSIDVGTRVRGPVPPEVTRYMMPARSTAQTTRPPSPFTSHGGRDRLGPERPPLRPNRLPGTVTGRSRSGAPTGRAGPGPNGAGPGVGVGGVGNEPNGSYSP